MSALFYLGTEILKIGLIVYWILGFVDMNRYPQAGVFKSKLDMFYNPILLSIKKWIRPIRVGNMNIEVSPVILYIIFGLLQKLGLFIL